MKKIMESWDKYLKRASQLGSDIVGKGQEMLSSFEKRASGNSRGCIEISKLALFTHRTEREVRLGLYKVQAKASIPKEELTKDDLIIKMVGQISLKPTEKPCIPVTYQVGTSAVAEEFQSKGYGWLMYNFAFIYAKQQGWGLTSDRGSTKAKARAKWKKPYVSDNSDFSKRKTTKGNTKFDYDGRTPDPEDDCEVNRFNRDFIATDNSWIGVASGCEEQYKKATKYHETINQKVPGDYNAFMERLRWAAQGLFGDEYMKSKFEQ